MMEMGCGDGGDSGRMGLVSKIRLVNLNIKIKKEKKGAFSRGRVQYQVDRIKTDLIAAAAECLIC
ncbi:hypothetical protein ACQP3D_27700, partial [Escherichia coli]